MAWILLFIAGLLEVVWAFSMKQSHGFTRLVPSGSVRIANDSRPKLAIIVPMVMTLGTAYTVWTGIGAVGAFLVGIAVLGEQISTVRILAAMMIVGGLVLMKLSSSH